jgi:hypothetical protein
MGDRQERSLGCALRIWATYAHGKPGRVGRTLIAPVRFPPTLLDTD